MGECIFDTYNTRASRALRWVLDPGRCLLASLALQSCAPSANLRKYFLAPPWPNPGSAHDTTTHSWAFSNTASHGEPARGNCYDDEVFWVEVLIPWYCFSLRTLCWAMPWNLFWGTKLVMVMVTLYWWNKPTQTQRKANLWAHLMESYGYGNIVLVEQTYPDSEEGKPLSTLDGK